MRSTLPVLLLLACLTGCASTQAARYSEPEPPPRKFQMRTYYIAFLRRGPAWTAERTPEAVAASEGHMANIRRLGACGKLLIAGPFDAGPTPPSDALAGLYLFDVPTREEALALAETDPAVRSGRFTIELMPWHGPAGLTYDGHQPPEPDARCEP